MEKRIITISREFGSGGRTIGKLVAEHLGIRCYDAELIQKLAAESGFDENYVKEAGEYNPGGFLFQVSLRVTVQNQVRIAQRIIVDEVIQFRPLCHSHIQCILNPGTVNGNFSPIEYKKSEPFSYWKKVRILLMWCTSRNSNPGPTD